MPDEKLWWSLVSVGPLLMVLGWYLCALAAGPTADPKAMKSLMGSYGMILLVTARGNCIAWLLWE